MTVDQPRSGGDRPRESGGGGTIDDLLDQAVLAVNIGDRAAATALAGQVLDIDGTNSDAEDLLTAEPTAHGGEIRRLAIIFADLVDSTVLSTRLEPEPYRRVVGKYRELVQRAVNRFGGHIASIKGDGLLAVFGHPVAHGNDVQRAARAGLDITRDVSRLSVAAQHQFGAGVDVRVGIHRGIVYLDTTQDDIYGFAANLAARLCSLAPPGSVVVSDMVATLIGDEFELKPLLPAAVKGVEKPVEAHLLVGERAEPSRIPRGPIVGRERELARLEKSWARARSGTLATPGLVFVGEPGIGKSRLSAYATELVGNAGGTVLQINGSPLHTDVGLHPIRNLIERRSGITRFTELDARLGLLENEIRSVGMDWESVAPLLAPVIGITPEQGYQAIPAESAALHHLITAGVTGYLGACMGSGPALVVAEDVHWFDASSVEVLGSLLADCQGRTLVLATSRSRDWLPRTWPVKAVDLAPLTDEQTEALTRSMAPSLTDDQRSQVRARCDGVPFFIEQVVDTLRAAPDDGSPPHVPDALYEPLFARLRSSANAIPVVQAAATIGRQGDRALLVAVLGLSDTAIDDVIDELEAARVFEPWGLDGWRFRHELLREVAGELAPPTLARTLHRRVADALLAERAAQPDWPLVAGHYELSRRFSDAATAYQHAADDARRRGSPSEALANLTKALEQLDQVAEGPERDHREIKLRLGRGVLFGIVDGYQRPAALSDFERCLQLLGSRPPQDDLIATLSATISSYMVGADLKRLTHVLEMLESNLDGAAWLRWTALSISVWLAWSKGDLITTQSLGESPAAEAVLAGAVAERVETTSILGLDPIVARSMLKLWNELMRGDVAAAQAVCTTAMRRAEELDADRRAYHVGQVDWLRFVTEVESGRFERAAEAAAAAYGTAKSHGIDTLRLNAATARAVASGLMTAAGEPLDGPKLASDIAGATKLLDMWRRIGLEIWRPWFDAIVGRLLIAAGELRKAREWLDTALDTTAQNGQQFCDAELRRLRAQTYSEPAERRDELAAVIEVTRRQGNTLYELRAALDDVELRGEPALAALIDVVDRIAADSPMPEVSRARSVIASHPRGRPHPG